MLTDLDDFITPSQVSSIIYGYAPKTVYSIKCAPSEMSERVFPLFRSGRRA